MKNFITENKSSSGMNLTSYAGSVTNARTNAVFKMALTNRYLFLLINILLIERNNFLENFQV